MYYIYDVFLSSRNTKTKKRTTPRPVLLGLLYASSLFLVALLDASSLESDTTKSRALLRMNEWDIIHSQKERKTERREREKDTHTQSYI